MRHFIINEQQLASLINYLEGRPYREVAQMVAGLVTLPQMPKVEDSPGDGSPLEPTRKAKAGRPAGGE